MCVLVNLSRVLRDYDESRNLDLETTCSQADVPRSIFAYSYHLKGNFLHAMTRGKVSCDHAFGLFPLRLIWANRVAAITVRRNTTHSGTLSIQTQVQSFALEVKLTCAHLVCRATLLASWPQLVLNVHYVRPDRLQTLPHTPTEMEFRRARTWAQIRNLAHTKALMKKRDLSRSGGQVRVPR